MPLPTSTPPTHVVSVQGSTSASTPGSHQGSGTGSSTAPDGLERSDRAVQAGPDLGWHVVAAVDDGGRSRVGAPGLGLLLVGEGEHAQGQDLVDLGGIAEVPGALGRHGRMVVEDDRRGQDHTGRRPPSPTSTGNVPSLAQPATASAAVVGRVEQRHEGTVVDREQRVDGDERPGHHRVAVGPAAVPNGGVLDLDGEPHQGGGAIGPGRRDPDDPLDRLTAAHRTADDDAGGRGERLHVVDRREHERVQARRPSETGSTAIRSRSISCSTASSHATQRAPSTSTLSAGSKPRPSGRATSTWRCCTWRQRMRTDTVASPPGSTTTSVRIAERSRAIGLRAGRRDEHTELPSELVLAGRGAVRVQHVPLVEHGVGHGPRVATDRSGSVAGSTSRPPRRPPSAAARRPPPRWAARGPP